MKLEILKCPSCGANIEVEEGADSCECEYCGATITVSKKSSQILSDKIKKFSKPNKEEATPGKKPRRKIFHILAIISFSIMLLDIIMGITDPEMSITIAMDLCFLVLAALFEILALTPKKSEYLFGRPHGIKTKVFVYISVVIALIFLFMMPASNTENTDNSDQVSTSISEQTTKTK